MKSSSFNLWQFRGWILRVEYYVRGLKLAAPANAAKRRALSPSLPSFFFLSLFFSLSLSLSWYNFKFLLLSLALPSVALDPRRCLFSLYPLFNFYISVFNFFFYLSCSFLALLRFFRFLSALSLVLLSISPFTFFVFFGLLDFSFSFSLSLWRSIRTGCLTVQDGMKRFGMVLEWGRVELMDERADG